GFLFPLGRSLRWAIATALIGSLLCVLFSPSIATSLDTTSASFLIRQFARSLISAALVVPWVHALRFVWRLGNPPSSFGRAALMLLAVVPPAAFADRVQESHRARFQQFQSTGRMVRARWELRGLIDLGQSHPIENQSLLAFLAQLDRQILDLEHRLPP